jgi:hypothetical protein
MSATLVVWHSKILFKYKIRTRWLMTVFSALLNILKNVCWIFTIHPSSTANGLKGIRFEAQYINPTAL